MDALVAPGGMEVASRAGSGAPPKYVNAALLIGGYASGQGAIFAVQTLLVAQDQLALLAAFGSAFSFAILAGLSIDFGALTVLSRETVLAEGDTNRIWANYWAITGWRFAIGLGAAALAATFAVLAADQFLSAYALWALPAALLWPFNATGILDGLRRGGLGGLTGSLPYLCSAVALLASMEASPGDAGALLGAALTLGCALALVGQFVALHHSGNAPRFVRPTARQTLTIGREAGVVFLATLPGQLYFRYQLLLANLILGPAGTALFVYAKQIATGFAQVIGFIRRVEFPELVARLTAAKGDPVWVQRTHRAGTLAGVAGSMAMLAGGGAGYLWLPGSLGDAALATATFAPVVIAGAFTTAITQGLQAVRRYGTAATAMAVGVAVGAGVNAMAVVWPALAVFVLADLAVYAIAAGISLATLPSTGKRVAP